MSVFVQGEPGANGTAGAPGVPGEDGAVGPKVRSRNLTKMISISGGQSDSPAVPSGRNWLARCARP